MKTDTLRFRDLLQKDIRLVVPLFQRPYVWNHALLATIGRSIAACALPFSACP